MPRYFFHLHQGDDVLIDSEGIDLHTIDALQGQALHLARDLLAADAATGVVDLDTMLRIVDESDTLVLRMRYADAVRFVSSGGK